MPNDSFDQLFCMIEWSYPCLNFPTAAVSLYQMLDDGQAETCTAQFTRVGFINTVETLAQFRYVIFLGTPILVSLM